MSEFAFLYLTYDNFTKANIYKNYKVNIYIHPKYLEKINNYTKQYIIKDLVPTEWGSYTIVQATLNLLKMAWLNESNKWFVLLSQDTYPLYNYDIFIKRFRSINKNSNKSIFNYIGQFKDYYKSSQWFILSRHDVSIILDNIEKFKERFIHNIPLGAIDEYYFLSVLKWNNKDYEYINTQIMHDRWLEYTVQKSPSFFNHLLDDDLIKIKKNKSLFIRKILPSFTVKKYKIKKQLYILYIGTETDQNKIIINDTFDYIILASINIDLIKKEIINKAIYIYNILYKFFYESVINLCNEDLIKKWNLVIFTTEQFDMQFTTISHEQIKLPYSKFYFIKKQFENTKTFYYIKDNKNNLAFCLKNL